MSPGTRPTDPRNTSARTVGTAPETPTMKKNAASLRNPHPSPQSPSPRWSPSRNTGSGSSSAQHRVHRHQPGIRGFAYNGFQRDQSPLRDLPHARRARLRPRPAGRYSDGLRTYGVNDMPELLDLAGERDMLVGRRLDRRRPESNARSRSPDRGGARCATSSASWSATGHPAQRRHGRQRSSSISTRCARRSASRSRYRRAWHVWLRYPELAKHVDYITRYTPAVPRGACRWTRRWSTPSSAGDEVARIRAKDRGRRSGWPSRGSGPSTPPSPRSTTRRASCASSSPIRAPHASTTS